MAAVSELVESGGGCVIKLRPGRLGTVPQRQRFIMKAHGLRVSLSHLPTPAGTEGTFTLEMFGSVKTDRTLFPGIVCFVKVIGTLTGL